MSRFIESVKYSWPEEVCMYDTGDNYSRLEDVPREEASDETQDEFSKAARVDRLASPKRTTFCTFQTGRRPFSEPLQHVGYWY
jgi:hypothetical protein